MASHYQPSFASGEITPSAYGRIDVAKQIVGLKTLRNIITRVQGNAVNRPGTEFVAEVLDNTKRGRFFPFVFSAAQSYVLDFGELTMEVIKDGGLVLEAAKTITATTNATPVVVTSTAHGFANGERVYIRGTGIAMLDNRYWFIANIAANTFELVGSTAPGSTSAIGTAERVFKLVTSYAVSKLAAVKYSQLGDVLTLMHSEIRMKDISRLAHDSWTEGNMLFEQGPFREINVDATKTMGSSAITGAATVTATGHTPFAAGDVGLLIYLEQKDYGQPWEVAKAVTAGDIRRSEGKYYEALNSATTGTLRPNNDSDNWHDGAVNWKYLHGGFGVIRIDAFVNSGSITGTVLMQIPTPAAAGSYRWALGAWGGDQGWPAVGAYFQQRRLLAATPAEPVKVWGSGTNAFKYFGKSSPLVDDDAINFTLAGTEVNAVRHLVSMGKLVGLTAVSASEVPPVLVGGGKWLIPDDDNNPILSPSHLSARLTADSVLYIGADGQTVFDLFYDFATNNFPGRDLSVLSKHLFEGHQIVAAAYQQVPFQIYWMVRDDGILIGMTYLREHEVWGFHRHDTDGYFEDVLVIHEGAEDVPYFRVRRTINGVEKRYIERLTSRLYTDIKDAFFVDCGLTYDGRNTGATTMTLNAGTLVLTASTSYFLTSHVGDEIHFTTDEGVVLRMRIDSYIGATSVNVILNRTAPVEFQSIAVTAWGHAKSTLAGLRHIEAKTVSILVDGHVHPQQVVTGGSITLEYAGVVVTAGLPITADFETLNINVDGQGKALDRQKNTFAIRLMVEESRGIFAGKDADHLVEYKQRTTETYDAPVDLFTGIASIRIPSLWEPGGRIFIRQTDPLPLSILAAMPELDMGGSK